MALLALMMGLLAVPARAADAVVPAKLIAVTYPVLSLAAGEDGRVQVRVTVGADATATACVVTVSSGHQRLDEAACHALTTRAQYQAATRDGVAVPWYIDTSVNFGPAPAPPPVTPPTAPATAPQR